MITCILIDDENNALEMMEWLLKTYCPQVQVLSMCHNGEEGIAAIHKLKPDVVFLDIEMPKMNGFDMLEQFEKLFFDVVFCTAYDQFAIKAFRYSALNYLLKPVDPDDLVQTVARIEEKKSVPTREQFELLLKNLQQGNKSTPARIALTSSDGLVFVPTREIIYCEAESNYTHVYMDGKRKITVSKILKDLDEALSGPDFFRVHSSYLVNLNRIKKLVRGEGGYLVMDNDATISISRSKKNEFMELFSRF